jgi:zinc protease
LDIAADVVLRPSFPAEEIERQRASRLAALVQQRENPVELAAQTAANVLYGPKHPYGYTEIGTEASVKAIARAEMLDFWKAHFSANNAALVVSGDISMGELRAAAEKSFGGWARGAATVKPAPEAVPVTPRIVIVNKPGAPQTQLRVTTIGAPRSTPDYAAVRVMNQVLGGLFNSRINFNLREEHGYTYGANSQFIFRRGPGPFAIASGVRTDVTAAAVSEIFKEIRKIRETPIGEEELTMGRDSLSRSLPANFETNESTVGNYANVFIYGLGLGYFNEYAAQVSAVTAQQAIEAAKKYVAPERLVIVAVGDAAQIEPELRKLNLGPVEVRNADGTIR